MAGRVAFFAGLATLASALARAGLIASVPSVRGAEGSGTFVVITDFHFNPFEPPELATALAGSAPAAWPATFTSAKDQAMSRTGEDTNHALLASSLAAFAKAAASADFAMSNDRAVDTYRRLYNVGRGELAGTLTAYFCAIGYLDRPSFTACYCGDLR